MIKNCETCFHYHERRECPGCYSGLFENWISYAKIVRVKKLKILKERIK